MKKTFVSATRLRRGLLLLGGLVSFALGTAGIFLPLLPTTVFWLIALACFSRSCPRFEHWMLNHPRYGRGLREYRDHGVIRPAGKRAALSAMLVSGLLSVALIKAWPIRFLVIGILSAVAWFISTRPESIRTGAMPPHDELEPAVCSSAGASDSGLPVRLNLAA
jgi:uncharacterized membrane protein YbaN (DUF454 family)